MLAACTCICTCTVFVGQISATFCEFMPLYSVRIDESLVNKGTFSLYTVCRNRYSLHLSLTRVLLSTCS